MLQTIIEGDSKKQGSYTKLSFTEDQETFFNLFNVFSSIYLEFVCFNNLNLDWFALFSNIETGTISSYIYNADFYIDSFIWLSKREVLAILIYLFAIYKEDHYLTNEQTNALNVVVN